MGGGFGLLFAITGFCIKNWLFLQNFLKNDPMTPNFRKSCQIVYVIHFHSNHQHYEKKKEKTNNHRIFIFVTIVDTTNVRVTMNAWFIHTRYIFLSPKNSVDLHIIFTFGYDFAIVKILQYCCNLVSQQYITGPVFTNQIHKLLS